MIMHGDLFDVLPTLEPNSFDACVTDPPYDLTTIGRSFQGSGGTQRPDGGQRSERRQGGFMRKKWDGTGIAFNPETWRQVFRMLKPGGYVVACGGTRTSHRMVTAIEDAGFEIRDALAWLYGSGFPKSKNLGDGRGTALKPAYEPIVLARKPFKGTIMANVEQHGTGALNIDACRIAGACRLGGVGESLDGGRIGSTAEGWDRPCKHDGDARQRTMDRVGQAVEKAQSLGRWPANVLLDEESAAQLDEMTGELTTGGGERGSIFRGMRGNILPRRLVEFASSTGGASRFYYVAKSCREERDFGCEGLPLKSGAECTDREEGTAGLGNPRAGAWRIGGGRNGHPTVKPVELMRWLVRLVTPPGGKVLDPFLGSGTTGMACRYEHRDFVGIEKELEYVDIARRRIAAVAPLFGGE